MRSGENNNGGWKWQSSPFLCNRHFLPRATLRSCSDMNQFVRFRLGPNLRTEQEGLGGGTMTTADFTSDKMCSIETCARCVIYDVMMVRAVVVCNAHGQGALSPVCLFCTPDVLWGDCLESSLFVQIYSHWKCEFIQTTLNCTPLHVLPILCDAHVVSDVFTL